ncbi:MAG: HAD-IIB family hydrolase [Candidatus Diapherotrites archaeon]|nr:HAD-IIB family hydrolase [Candidatus Diapherotrites archaeon]
MFIRRYEKVLLLDYDGVLAEDLKLDERTIIRLKELLGQGFKIAIITGRTPSRTSELINALEKHGIADKISIFCERGCVELKRSQTEWHAHLNERVKNFKLEEWGKASWTLHKLAEKFGIAKALTNNIVSFYFSSKKAGFKLSELQSTVRKIVDEINRSGRIKTKLIAIPTQHGMEILPHQATKALAAQTFLSRVGKPYYGFALGDMFADRKMALGSKIKFLPVKSPDEFLKISENLPKLIAERRRKLAKLLIKRRLKAKLRKLKRKLGRA